jgi:mevalonate kinase
MKTYTAFINESGSEKKRASAAFDRGALEQVAKVMGIPEKELERMIQDSPETKKLFNNFRDMIIKKTAERMVK